jgi:prepilin-type N-terminal cleavage/methylation domain-containing protein
MRRRLGRLATDQRGMSLAEILVACVIIGIGLVGLLSAIPTASYGLQEGRQLSTATFLVNQRLEQVRNAAWTSTPANDCLGTSASSTVAPTSAVCNGTAVTTFPDEAPIASPYTDYTRTTRVIDCSVGVGCGGVVNATFRQVTVVVSYQPATGTGVAAAGTTKSAIVSMLVAQR